MGVQSRINSGQSASPYALDPHFIRQLRNFMNNWVVEGGHFHFDGYRARLRIQQQPATESTPSKPFRIYQLNGNIMTIPMSAAMMGYAPDPETPSTLNWSLQVAVTNLALDNFADDGGDPPVMTNPIGTSAMDDGKTPPGANTELYDGNASADPAEAQTYYRIPIIRGGERVCNGGAYRENLVVRGSIGPSVELIRI